MNPRIVLRIISYLLLIVLRFLMLTAVGVALCYHEYAVARAFFLPVVGTALLTGLFLYLSPASGPFAAFV